MKTRIPTEYLITNPEYKVANRDAMLEVLRVRVVKDKRMITLIWRTKKDAR